MCRRIAWSPPRLPRCEPCGRRNRSGKLMTEPGSSGRHPDVGVVVIGRNEGERLRGCLESVRGAARVIVYVDSGSADDSVALAIVQFVDGDCEMVADWLLVAERFLGSHPQVAAVCGRRRERFPEQSIYNLLCDLEWNTPIGEARACGGDVMMRTEALRQVKG